MRRPLSYCVELDLLRPGAGSGVKGCGKGAAVWQPLPYFMASYFFLVAMPPRMWRWALFTASTSFTSWYRPLSMYFSRWDTSLCFVVTN